jgi:hypothetical protein
MHPALHHAPSTKHPMIGPDWSSWVVIAVIVLLVCGLVFYWLSFSAV